MTNYTEQLKRYWKSKDLAFIAELNKIDEKHGYFKNFTNPSNRKLIEYPEFLDFQLDENRVSFIYFQVASLVHGNYYKVELDHTNNPKGKNNPYSLRIKSISPLNQKAVEELLSKNKDENRYEGVKLCGCYRWENEKFASFD